MKILDINDISILFDLSAFENLDKISKNIQDEVLRIENDLVNYYNKVCYSFEPYLKSSRAIKNFLLHSSIPYFFTNDKNKENSLYPLWHDVLNCHKCKSIIKRPTVYFGNFNPIYLFIGEAPGVGDGVKYTYDRVFVYGPTSHLLRNTLNKLNIFLDSGFTNLLKDALPNNRKGEEEEYSNCYPKLLNEILFLNPKKIILMGNNVINFLKNKIKKQYEVILINHPSYFFRSNKSEEFFFHLKEKLCI